MALPKSLTQREKDKFTDDGSGNTAVRIFGVSSSNTSGAFVDSLSGREKNKFILDDSGEVAVNIIAA